MHERRRNRSLFQLIDRKIFDRLATKWEIDKGIRTFSTWEMTSALLDSLTLRLDSLREIEETLKIPRSTFADALKNRCSGFFQDLCDEILLGIRARTRNRKIKRAIRQILAIDSTECEVHGSLFARPGWAKKTGEQRKASCKLHVVWDIDQEWVSDFIVTGARKSDSPASLKLQLESGKTYVFDRAYHDFNYWLKIMDLGSHFVTRLKESATLMQQRISILRKMKGRNGVLHDGIYTPAAATLWRYGEKLEGRRFRHIIYRDAETQKVFHFVTSDFSASAQMIADIYKRRWAVELLFRWLKGHLGIRRLPERKSNGVEIRLAAAVLLQLLLRLQKEILKYDGTLWELLRSIRTQATRQTVAQQQDPGTYRRKRSSAADLMSESS